MTKVLNWYSVLNRLYSLDKRQLSTALKVKSDHDIRRLMQYQ